MPRKVCDTCRHWDNSATFADAEPGFTGLCRVRPPVVDPIRPGMGLWPFTEDNDWCASWIGKGAEANG